MDANLTVPQTPVKTDSITGHENTTDTWGEDKCLLFPKHESPEDDGDKKQGAFVFGYTNCTECVLQVFEGVNEKFIGDPSYVEYSLHVIEIGYQGLYYSPVAERGMIVTKDTKNGPDYKFLVRRSLDVSQADLDMAREMNKMVDWITHTEEPFVTEQEWLHMLENFSLFE